jgi:hypothetical protein
MRQSDDGADATVAKLGKGEMTGPADDQRVSSRLSKLKNLKSPK